MDNDVLKELFSNNQYCVDEILRIRKAWGFKDTFTFKHIEAMQKTLGLMYLYCPDDLQNLVQATLNELSMREFLISTTGSINYEI